MSKRIYFTGYEEGETCEVGEDLLPGVWGPDAVDGECGQDAVYCIEDRQTGVEWYVCADHKEAVKEAGIAS